MKYFISYKVINRETALSFINNDVISIERKVTSLEDIREIEKRCLEKYKPYSGYNHDMLCALISIQPLSEE